MVNNITNPAQEYLLYEEVINSTLKNLEILSKKIQEDIENSDLENSSKQDIKLVCSKITNVMSASLGLCLNRLKDNKQDFKESDLKKSKILNNVLEAYVDVLESILDFKQEVDKKFPGASDFILKISAPLTVCVVSSFNPIIGAAIHSSGVLDKVADFLQTENLEKNIERAKSAIERIENDEILVKSYITGKEIANLSEVSGIIANSLTKIGLQNIKETTDYIKTNSKGANNCLELIQELCKYSDRRIPQNQAEIKEKLNELQNSVIQSLENSGVSSEIISELRNNIDLRSASSEMEKTLLQKNNVFDNIQHVQKSADKLSSTYNVALNEIEKKHSISKEDIKHASKIINDQIKHDISGDLSKISALALKKGVDGTDKEILKKNLGIKLSSEEVLRKNLINDRSRGM